MEREKDFENFHWLWVLIKKFSPFNLKKKKKGSCRMPESQTHCWRSCFDWIYFSIHCKNAASKPIIFLLFLLSLFFLNLSVDLLYHIFLKKEIHSKRWNATFWNFDSGCRLFSYYFLIKLWLKSFVKGFDLDGTPRLYQTDPSGIYSAWKVSWILSLSFSFSLFSFL